MDLTYLIVDPETQKEEYSLIDPRTDQPLTDENGKEVTLTLWGPDSTVLQKIMDQHVQKTRAQASKKGKVDFLKAGQELSFEKSVAAVDDWTNVGFDGEELECTEENIRKIFKAAPWIQEQVQVFISDRANFMNDSDPANNG